MELSHQMRRRNAVLRAAWLPRLQNEEADALTNGDYRHFDRGKRIPVSLADLRFGVLDSPMEEGLAYLDEVSALRAKESEARAAAATAKQDKARKRKRAGETLRDREP